MESIKRILLPTDFSKNAQNAFRYALLLADRVDAELHVMHAVFPQVEAFDVPVVATQSTLLQVDAAKETMKSFVDAGLTQVVRRLKKVPVIKSSVKIGTALGNINKRVAVDEIGLVVMGAKGARNVVDKMLGSVALDVLEKVDCPVLIVPQAAEAKEMESFAYATDLQKEDPFEIWKTVKLMEPICSSLKVVHVSQTENVDKDQAKLHELKSFFKDRPVTKYTSFHQVEAPSVEEGLLDFISRYTVGIMVMFHPKKNYIERLFTKSHTKGMVFQSNIPLLVVKE